MDIKTRRVYKEGVGAGESQADRGLFWASDHWEGDGGAGWEERQGVGSECYRCGVDGEGEGGIWKRHFGKCCCNLSRDFPINHAKQALNQMHRDIVFEYPEGVEKLAFTDKCAVQGMYLSKKFISVQGHPEFNEGIVRELLTARHASGLFDDAMFEDAWNRAGNQQDGVVVAKAFLKFLLD